MKIVILRKELEAALTAVKSVASAKAELPVLSNVAIRTHEKSVDFTCSNLSLFIRVNADATITGKGDDFTVRVSLFHDLVKSFTGEHVEIETSKKSIEFRCGGSKYHLGTLGIEEFPSTPRVNATTEFKLTEAYLRTLLTSTAYCARTADTQRPSLCGSLFEVNGMVTVVGCDGRRLALMSVPLEDKVKPTDVIVPREAVGELLRLVGDDEKKTVALSIGEKLVQFQFQNTTLISKIVDAKYPPYGKTIPKLEGEGIPIGRADLLNALKRVNLIEGRCSLEFRRQTLTISAESDGKDVPGDGQESLLIPDSPELTVRFETSLLIEALSAITDEEILFFGRPNESAVFKVKDKPWLALTAPLRLNADKSPAKESAPKGGTPQGAEPAKK